MPKQRKRLFTPNRYRFKGACSTSSTVKFDPIPDNDVRDSSEVTSARGRLKGALKEVLEPTVQSEESEQSAEETSDKHDRQSPDKKEYLTDEEVKRAMRKSPPRQSYVLKLFDRSVDLSQFRDDSPLYPICRAWMINQPKVNYSDSCLSNEPDTSSWPNSAELPPPEGPPVAKLPQLLPEQLAADKDNINLNYRETGPPPTREQLLRLHMPRWAAVKQAWQDQIVLKEARYEGTQRILNSINLEYPSR